MKATTLPTLRERWKQLSKQPDLTNIDVIGLFDGYIGFTAQKLALWMFVACNSKGEPMEKPKSESFDLDSVDDDNIQYAMDVQEYWKALDACIFEGCSIEVMPSAKESGRLLKSVTKVVAVLNINNNKTSWVRGAETIEELITSGIPLTLKPNHAKKLGL